MITNSPLFRYLLLLMFLGSTNCLAVAEELVPEDECIVELAVPEGATVNVDGKDYDTQRIFTFSLLKLHNIYKSNFTIRYPSGNESKHTLLLKGGHRVRLAKQDPAENMLELVASTGLPPITGWSCSQDWKYLIASHQNNSVSVWNMQEKKFLRHFGEYDLTLHDRSIVGVHAMLNPDGTTLLTRLEDLRLVALYNVTTGQRLRTFKGHTSSVGPIAFSPDGKTVVTGSDDKTAILWNATTGRRLRTFKGHTDSVNLITFSPDGKKILTGHGGHWDLNRNKFLPGFAVLWDIATGQRLQTFAFKEHTEPVSSVAFSPDGKTLVTGSYDETAILWDATTGHKLHSFKGHAGHVITSVAFSPDGKTVVTGCSNNTAILWDATTGHELRSFKGHTGTFKGYTGLVYSVAFSPDGKQLFVGAFKVATIWDVQTGKKQSSFRLRFQQSWYPSLSSNKSILAVKTPEDNTIDILNIKTGKKVSEIKGIQQNLGSTVALSPDGKTVVTGSSDNTAILWDVTTGQRIRTFKGHTYSVTSVGFSPDGKTLITGSIDTSILWDVTTGQRIRTFKGHTYSVTSVGFSPGGKTLITFTRSSDNPPILWDATTGQRLRTFKGHTKSVSSSVFSPDGRTLVTGSYDNTAILWDTTTGQRLRTFKGHTSFVVQVAFSPDGKTVFTGSYDNTAILWDATTGQRLRTFKGYTGSFNPIAFSSDSAKLLTVDESAVILWDVVTGKELRRFRTPSHDYLRRVSFDTAGNHVLLFGFWRLLYVWDVATGELVISGSKTDNGILFTTPEGLFDGPADDRSKVSYRIGHGLNILPVDQFFDGFYYPGLLAAILRGERPLPKLKIELPPVIRIVSPTPKSTTGAEKVVIEALIEDQGGGIQKPVVKLNGSEYLIDELPVQENEKQLRWRFTIPLVSGVENVISIHSATSSGAIASEAGSVVVKCEKPRERPELYMVAVGISDYVGQLNDLQCARNDAETLAKIFRERGEAFYGKDKVHVTTVVDSQATIAGIKKAIAKIAKAAKPHDIFILTLAGHGVTLGERYYFITYDYKTNNKEWQDERVRQQGLPEDKLDDWIATIPATKRVLVYDTCQSGSVLGRSTSYERTLEALARRSGCHVIAAAASSEEAQELPDIGHGALTYTLMAGLGAANKGLLKNRNAASDDGLVGVLNWFQFAAENVPAITKQSLGKEQFIEFKSKAANFPILPIKTKEKD